jgi:hypothetical protein
VFLGWSQDRLWSEVESEHFFVDNGWLGGGENVFFDADVPAHFESPFVPDD